MPVSALSNPFPGLRPFEPDEDHLFFGREKEVDGLLRRLRTTRFLAMVGTSGSGKSSLIRCGLIPALQSGYMAKAGSSWRIAILRPGADPIGNLAAALNAPDVLGSSDDTDGTSRIMLDVTLRRSTLGLVEALRQAQTPPEDNLLVVVDQFEELFRFRQGCQNADLWNEAVVFVKLLLEATRQHSLPIYVGLTMRSDFIGDCMAYPGLPEAVNEGMYLVPRMTRDELRSAITGPVAVEGGEIAPRLVLRLLNDIGDDQDQLPVLQHSLMRTWDHWARREAEEKAPIDVVDYESVGALRHALSLHAEEAYSETVSGGNERITERMFKALTDTYSDGRGVRRPSSISELAAICAASESQVIQIVEIFRQRGRSFLMPPAGVELTAHSIVDISHESLMRCWDRLIGWAEEERRSAEFYLRVSKAAAWFEEGTAGLWRDPELEFGIQWWLENDPNLAWAERYDGSFMSVIEFLDLSRKERDRAAAEREKARRRKLQWVSGLAGVFAILTSVAFFFFYSARKETARAESNLLLARKAVDESLSSAAAASEQASEFPDPPQLAHFKRELLNKAEEFYSSFLAKESANDPRFRADRALVHSKLGDINRLSDNRENAVREYTSALQEFNELNRQDPGNVEYRLMLGYVHTWLGETFRRWAENTRNVPDRQSSAEQEYESALALQQGLHGQEPQNAEFQQELARTYDNRGILDYDLRDLQKCESDFNQAIGLLEPLVTAELASETKEGDNPPSHDLVLTYNNLSVLMRAERQPARAEDLSERALRIQQALVDKAPDNLEFRQELAVFQNNLAVLAYEKGDIDIAKQQNHAALDGIEDLATPAAAMEAARASAHMFYQVVGSPDHPEFHVLYMHLGDEFVKLASDYLRGGETSAARMAIQNLGRILPDVAEPYRTKLRKHYVDLQKELSELETKKK